MEAHKNFRKREFIPIPFKWRRFNCHNRSISANKEYSTIYTTHKNDVIALASINKQHAIWGIVQCGFGQFPKHVGR